MAENVIQMGVLQPHECNAARNLTQMETWVDVPKLWCDDSVTRAERYALEGLRRAAQELCAAISGFIWLGEFQYDVSQTKTMHVGHVYAATEAAKTALIVLLNALGTNLEIMRQITKGPFRCEVFMSRVRIPANFVPVDLEAILSQPED